MAEDEVEHLPGTRADALKFLAGAGREFLDYAALFVSPGADLIPDEYRVKLSVLAEAAAEELAAVIAAARFDVDAEVGEWEYGDGETFRSLIPGFAALIAGLAPVHARWANRDEPLRERFRVEPAELALMVQGIAAVERWMARQPLSPPGWRVMVHEGKVIRLRVPNWHVRVISGDPPMVVLDGDTSFEVTPAVAAYVQALLDAEGAPVKFGDIKDDPRYPELSKKNETDIRNAIERLAPPVSDLIKPAQGFRIIGFGTP